MSVVLVSHKLSVDIPVEPLLNPCPMSGIAAYLNLDIGESPSGSVIAWMGFCSCGFVE
jgi:hypothetical protein